MAEPDDSPATETVYPEGNHGPAVERTDLENTQGQDFSFGDAPEGKPLDPEAAMRIIRKRMPFSRSINRVLSTQGDFQEASSGNLLAELTRKMVSLIPASHYTKEFLETVDLRPMLKEVMQAPAQVQDPQAKTEVRGLEFSGQERAIAAIMVADQTDKVRKRIYDAYMADIGGEPGSEGEVEARNMANELANRWRDGEDIHIPSEAKPGTVWFNPDTGKIEPVGNLSDGNQTDATNSLTDGLDTLSANPTKFMRRHDLQKITQSGELTIDVLGQWETNPDEMRGYIDGEVPAVGSQGAIQYNDPEKRTRMSGPDHLMSNAKPETYESKDWYSVRDILSKPGEMSQNERMAIHEKMKKAGLYDLVGGEPVIPGDSTDPAFKAAWKMLASMSLETQKSMTSILAERTTAYQQELESSLSVYLTDPARQRINGDAYARTALGRKLNDEEHEALSTFLHNLERENARREAGLDINSGDSDPIEGVEPMDEAINADIDAQMQQWIRENNSAEAGAHDIADQYDMFTSLIRGPGRGI